MARFNKGWFAVSRKITNNDPQNNDFHGDFVLKGLWVTLIGWANVKDGKTKVRGKLVPVKRGEVITSYAELARAGGVGIKVARNRVSYLEKTGRLGRIKGTRGLHLRVEKYDDYQKPYEERGSTKGIKGAREGHEEGIKGAPSGQRIRQEYNNNQETRKPSNNGEVDVQNISSDDYQLADRWFLEHTLKIKPWIAEQTPNHQDTITEFATAIAECRSEMNITQDGMREIFEYIAKDKFWQEHTTHPKSLLTKNSEGTRKIETILVRLSRGARKYKAAADWAATASDEAPF